MTAQEKEDYVSWQWAREERGSNVPKSDPAEDMSNTVYAVAMARGSPKAAQDLARRGEEEAKRMEAHHASLRASEDISTGSASLRHFLGGQALVPVGSAHEDDRGWILGCSPPPSPPRSRGSRKLQIGRLSRALSPSEARLFGVQATPLLGTPNKGVTLPAGARPNAMLRPGTVLGQRLMAPDTSLTRLSRVPSPPATTTVMRRARLITTATATDLAVGAPRDGASASPTAEVSWDKSLAASEQQPQQQQPQGEQSPQRRGPRRAKQAPALCSSLRHASWAPSPPPLSAPPRSPAAPSSPTRSHTASPTMLSPLLRAISLPCLRPPPTRPKLQLRTPSPASSPQPSSSTGGHMRSRSPSPGPQPRPCFGLSPDLDSTIEDSYGAAEVHRELDLFEKRNSPKQRRGVQVRAH